MEYLNANILVLGDVMLDSYIYGSTDRISNEAPVVIVDVNKRVMSPGGAANVAVNISNLGAKCSLIGRIGYDDNGKKLTELLLKKNIDFTPVSVVGHNTITKTRVISKHQQLLRFDEECIDDLCEGYANSVLALIKNTISHYDIVVISDYGKGFCTDYICKKTIKLASENNVKVLVDPKGIEWEKYNDSFLISPNVKELAQICNCTVDNNSDEAVVEIGREIYNEYHMDYLLVTRSERGATLINKDIEHHVPSVTQEVFDVSGAGDTMIAVIAVYLAYGDSIEKSIDMAIKASGIVISKVGTVPITYEELLG